MYLAVALFLAIPEKQEDRLQVARKIYEVTSSYGHLGRIPDKKGSFSWEKTDKTNIFNK